MVQHVNQYLKPADLHDETLIFSFRVAVTVYMKIINFHSEITKKPLFSNQYTVHIGREGLALLYGTTGFFAIRCFRNKNLLDIMPRMYTSGGASPTVAPRGVRVCDWHGVRAGWDAVRAGGLAGPAMAAAAVDHPHAGVASPAVLAAAGREPTMAARHRRCRGDRCGHQESG